MVANDASASAKATNGLFSLGRKSKSEIPERVTVRLSDEMRRAVGEILDATPSEAPTDVVRRALVLYHTLLMQKLEGNEPFIDVHEKDGTRRVPVFF